MTKLSYLLGAAALFAPALLIAQTTAPATGDSLATARAAALEDRVALDFVRDITTEVGQRLAGTEAEGRARVWAAERLRAMGFANVRIQTYQMPTWVRGEERAVVISPYPQALILTALGNSGATPAAGLEAEVVAFPSLSAFEAAADQDVRGKIVYIGHVMRPTQDGSSYGPFG